MFDDEMAQMLEKIPRPDDLWIGGRDCYFQSTSDMFLFIDMLVCIGAVGAYAFYRIWKDFYRNDR
jgi:hypothetical protein